VLTQAGGVGSALSWSLPARPSLFGRAAASPCCLPAGHPGWPVAL